MKRTVLGLFKSLHQAERALREIENSGYANSQISLVIKNSPAAGQKFNEEYAAEISGDPKLGLLHDFDGFFVQANSIEVPDTGTVSAGGPLAGALIQGDKSIAQALTYYGVDTDRAFEVEKAVNQGQILVVIETESAKANKVANILDGYGAHDVAKWSRTIDKPMRTRSVD